MINGYAYDLPLPWLWLGRAIGPGAVMINGHAYDLPLPWLWLGRTIGPGAACKFIND